MFKITKIHVSGIFFVISFLVLVFIFIIILSLPPFTIDTSDMATPVTEAGFQFIYLSSFTYEFIPVIAAYNNILNIFFVSIILFLFCIVF